MGHPLMSLWFPPVHLLWFVLIVCVKLTVYGNVWNKVFEMLTLLYHHASLVKACACTTQKNVPFSILAHITLKQMYLNCRNVACWHHICLWLHDTLRIYLINSPLDCALLVFSSCEIRGTRSGIHVAVWEVWENTQHFGDICFLSRQIKELINKEQREPTSLTSQASGSNWLTYDQLI